MYLFQPRAWGPVLPMALYQTGKLWSCRFYLRKPFNLTTILREGYRFFPPTVLITTMLLKKSERQENTQSVNTELNVAITLAQTVLNTVQFAKQAQVP